MGYICSDPCLSVIESRDLTEIKKLIFHEDIHDSIFSDEYTSENAERILDTLKVIYYLFKVNEDIVGYCAFLNTQTIVGVDDCYISEVGFIKSFRGKLSYRLSKMAIQKFITEVKPYKLFAPIKHDNRRSLFFALQIGFKIVMRDDNYCLLEAKG